MIVKDRPSEQLPADPTPVDAPPAYDDIAAAGPSSARPTDVKTPISAGLSPGPSSLSTTSPGPRSPNSPGSAKGGFKTGFSWWGSGPSREVKSTVQGLIRDLVKPLSNVAAASIIESCAEACSSSFDSILQEKYIEGHTPLYWAIINSHPGPSTHHDELINRLFAYATPLSATVADEVRLACLVTDDQARFGQLQRYLHPPTGADDMILSSTPLRDSISVATHPDGDGSFAVSMSVPLFQKRMHMRRTVSFEFIASGRMWRFELFLNTTERIIARPGQWCARVRLMEHSPPTWLDSQVLVDPRAVGDKVGKLNTLSMRVKGQLMPKDAIVVVLDEALQFSASPYMQPDGTLKVRLEARLQKPNDECIIC